MSQNATLEIPNIGRSNPARFEDLSDEAAMDYGMFFGRCLSEQDGFAVVTLSDGERILFGNGTI